MKYLNKLIPITFTSFLFLVVLFTRSFVGIQFGSFRLGEIIVFGCLLWSIISIIFYNKLRIGAYFDKNLIFTFSFIIIIFLLLSIISQSSFFNPYTYKTSSYIWTFSILFLSIWIFKTFDFNDKYFIIFIPIPFIMYLFSTGNYPDFIINFFKEYSDKFNFLKASDIMLATIGTNIFARNLVVKKDFQIIYFMISSSLILPLLLFMSRGSFVGLMLFVVFEIFYERSYFKLNKLKSIIIFIFSILVFLSSLVYVDYLYVNEETKTLQYNEILVAPGNLITESVNELALKNDTRKVFLSFYIHYGRLESRDPTTNWRLDIWQDIIFDMVKENKLINAYGYKEILPQMTDPTAPGRLGRDGLNENVHSYFVNILARGGLLQLFAFFYLYIGIIKKWRSIKSNYRILSLIIPVLFCASLDIAMEGVQFPIVFFVLLGYILYFENLNTNKEVDKVYN
ncbi:hypothetical protein N9U41_00490 [Acidimicrobiaceae bacterium]|nr:hypothetical protein [Acidimicrobiaceae bacterium]